jgi:hypothetical protein
MEEVSSQHRLPISVSEKMGYYVYVYIDPRTDKIFYVGKGSGSRVLYHLLDAKPSAKSAIISELSDLGLEPRIEIISHGIKEEETAYRIEAAVIDSLGLKGLTNEVRGWKSIQYGRIKISELGVLYDPEEVEIEHKALIIRINKTYKKEMTQTELFEVTSGIWKLSDRRVQVDYALATFYGVVREIYKIDSWMPAGTRKYFTRSIDVDSAVGRWEFSGKIAPCEIRALYLNKSVKSYLKNGMQSPTLYVNC